ncbi:hypothetical protein TYRP_017911 [Tyrophagus putrescentiae]|nr:hypothetical protein TYRP_017911 [Tyrophagus putrescentiae]
MLISLKAGSSPGAAMALGAEGLKHRRTSAHNQRSERETINCEVVTSKPTAQSCTLAGRMVRLSVPSPERSILAFTICLGGFFRSYARPITSKKSISRVVMLKL